MSGHSKWSQIKHKKALTDAKKGKIFSKLVRQISVAARAKGGDPEANPTLRVFIDKARSFNMPQDNIERAIKKGTGEIEGVKFEEYLLEAYGPAGIAIIIEGTSDNKNRTVSEIKFLLGQHEGKLANPGSVLWLFDRCGAITANRGTLGKDEIELAAIDAGAQDLKWIDDNVLEIYTEPENMDIAKRFLQEKEISIEDASLDWKAKNEVAVEDKKSREQLEKLFEALDEDDDVNEIYSNLKQ